MSQMSESEITSLLEEKREQYDKCCVEDALASSVDTERFYRFAACIQNLTVSGERVKVTFDEPVPGATNLADGYTYSVSVARKGEKIKERTRCEMPKRELITLQQIAILIWALATGEMY